MKSFAVIPAVDVLDGRCVRLSEGRREQVTIEGGDPSAAVARFVSDGAEYLHVVDLDGAFAGSPTPGLAGLVAAAAGGVPFQIGGGLRDEGSIRPLWTQVPPASSSERRLSKQGQASACP